MGRANLSVRSLLVLIALLSIGLALIAAQSRLASDTALTIYWSVILLALSGAFVTGAEVRAFCTGVAVFGLGYWFLAFENDGTAARPGVFAAGSWRFAWGSAEEGVDDRFLTSDLIDWVEDSVRPRVAVGAAVDARYNNGGFYTGKVRAFDGTDYIIAWDDGTQPSPVPPTGIRGLVSHVRTAAHAVLGLMFALVGGLATVVLRGVAMRWPVSRPVPADPNEPRT